MKGSKGMSKPLCFISDDILIPLLIKHQKERKQVCDGFPTEVYERIKQDSGGSYANVSVDDLRRQSINLRKKGILGSVNGEVKVSVVENDIPPGMKKYYDTDHWVAYSKEVRRFWNGRCAVCCAERNLKVFHRTFENLGMEMEMDCIPLCAQCYRMATHRRKRERMKARADSGGYSNKKPERKGPFF